MTQRRRVRRGGGGRRRWRVGAGGRRRGARGKGGWGTGLCQLKVLWAGHPIRVCRVAAAAPDVNAPADIPRVEAWLRAAAAEEAAAKAAGAAGAAGADEAPASAGTAGGESGCRRPVRPV